MKRVLAISLALVMLTAFMAGCASSETESPQPPPADTPAEPPAADSPAEPPPEAPPAESVTLQFMFYSPELQEAYDDMVAAYHEYTGGRVTIEIFLDQNEYQVLLDSRLRGGDIPDVFMSSAYADNEVFRAYTYDLTNEPFMQNIDPSQLVGVTVGGAITGYPFAPESHAFIYNKDIFDSAGITKLPETLAELEEVCKTLEAAGIQPFATGFGEWWVLPQTVYPTLSDIYGGNYEALLADIQAGVTTMSAQPEIDFVLDVLDLIKKYGGNRPMESNFDDQIASMANGSVAMAHQGNWAEGGIVAANPGINIGYVLHPRLNGKAVLAVDSNKTMRVGNNENLQETLAWLEWLTTSDYGKAWIPEKAGQMSPLKGAAAPNSQLAEETAIYISSGQAAPWWMNLIPGYEQPLGELFQEYVAGSKNRDQLKADLDALIDMLYANA